jgi:succinate dehydrogenase / fumarate reductase cytochrome b subunit
MPQRIDAPRKYPLERFVERSIRGDRMGPGAYVWAAHRLSGLILTIYLFVHLYVLSSVLDGADPFDRLMETMENPVIRLLELALVAAVLFHTLNGIRLLLLHFFPHLNQKRLAYAATGITVFVVVISLPLFI